MKIWRRPVTKAVVATVSMTTSIKITRGGLLMRRHIMLCLLLLTVTACGTPATDTPTTAAPTPAPVAAADPCGDAALLTYRRAYNDIISRWGTATVQAGKVPPADLQHPIEELQKLVD